MTSRDFAYWLQGFFELTDSDTVTLEQVKMIKNHLNMVFHHDIDKSFGKDLPALKSPINRTQGPEGNVLVEFFLIN